jgi:hypothetical protein
VPSRIGTAPFQAGPQHEYSLTEVKLDRNQQQTQAHWTDREDHQGGQHESGPEITAVEDVMQGDRQSERGERDDLAKTAQRRCEPLDLAFVGGAGVADQDAGQKDREETGTVAHRGHAVNEYSDGDRPHRVERLVRQRQTHHLEQRVPADRDIHRHLQCELADAAEHVAPAAASGAENANHQRDADWIVRTRLALEQRARSARHFPTPKHGEHHRRVSRRERGTDEQRRAPTKAEQPLRGQCKGGSRHR